MAARVYPGAAFRPSAWRVVVVVVLLVASALAGPAALWVVRDALQAVERGESLAALRTAGALVVLLALGQAVALIMRTWLTKSLAWQAVHELRVQVFERAVGLGAAGQSSGDLLAAVTVEVDEAQLRVSAWLTLLRDPLTLLVLVVYAIYIAPSLAVVAGPVWLLALLPAWFGGGAARAVAKRARAARASLSAQTSDQLGRRRAIQVHGAIGREVERFRSASVLDYSARVLSEVARTISVSGTQLGAAAGLGAVLSFGSMQVEAGNLALADVVAFIGASLLLARPASRLAEAWSMLKRSEGALDRVDRLLKGPAAPADRDVMVRADMQGLSLHGVWAARGDQLVLSELDLEVGAGEVVAIVGLSGAGKSTLLDVIGGALPTLRGEVRLGGEPVAAGPWLARGVALVSQQDELLDRSVAENLRLGAPDAEDEDLKAALKAVGLEGWLARRSGGLDAQLGELGGALSGGERQRLALARALLTGAPVLLLDEPSAHVDADATEALAGLVRGLAGRKTLVIVAHDPALASAADRVVLLRGGRIVRERTVAQTRGFGMWSGQLGDA